MNINFDLFDKNPFPEEKSVLPEFYRGDTEEDMIADIFTGKKLNEVNYKIISDKYIGKFDFLAIPSLMGDEAFVYFLPSLIQLAIDGEHDDTQLSELGFILSNKLLDIARGSDKERLNLIEKMYNERQLREFSKFLVEWAKYDDPDAMPVIGDLDDWWNLHIKSATDALHVYWGKYL